MSSYSDPHFDAAGYGTFIYIVSGSKLWCQLPRGKPPLPGEDWNIKGNGWVASYLQAGDFLCVAWFHPLCYSLNAVVRFMQPGTPHIVITTGNCIAYGAHFYSLNTLHATFAAMVADHFVGINTVNTEHTRAPLLLFKGLDATLEKLRVAYGGGPWPEEARCLSLYLSKE